MKKRKVKFEFNEKSLAKFDFGQWTAIVVRKNGVDGLTYVPKEVRLKG